MKAIFYKFWKFKNTIILFPTIKISRLEIKNNEFSSSYIRFARIEFCFLNLNYQYV